MDRMIAVASLALGLVVFGAPMGWAAAPPPPQHCASEILPTAQRIKSCLAATEAKDVARDQLAMDYLDLAKAYEAWGDRRRELDALGKAIALKPDLWEARTQRAQLLLQSTKFDQALPDYLALKKAFPGAAPPVVGAASPEAQAMMADPKKRAAFMLASLERELTMRATRSCGAKAMAGLELESAYKDCAIAIQIGGDKMIRQPHESLGIALFRAGNWKGAIAQFDIVLQHNPKTWSSLYLKGIVERRAGNTAQGDADIATAEKNNPPLAQQGARAGLLP